METCYNAHGIRFNHPADWEIDSTDDGPRTIVSATDPTGAAFLFVTLDADRHAPDELVDEVLRTLREEYPTLDAYPVLETLGGVPAVGQDFEFFYLDLISSGFVRAFRTARRSILVYGQWSDPDDGSDYAALFDAIRHSLSESDAPPRSPGRRGPGSSARS
ncbi:MAG: hypothetical protein KatS3mg108_0380 [Isosphaeraceae bacterium]|jgi:hypothetical protein|nr:MAG: hypothetical protein KatS3mg108_0380 [Isosphaeraceae bacterium]